MLNRKTASENRFFLLAAPREVAMIKTGGDEGVHHTGYAEKPNNR